MKRARKRTLNTACGVSSACLCMWLTSCASAPNLLPSQRVVVACPAELQYRPVRQFPPLPMPLLNRGLQDFVDALLDQLEETWARVEQSNNDCAKWLKGQGLK